jgi:ABC-type multidrug transport system fused ATPase/permease subunit
VAGCCFETTQCDVLTICTPLKGQVLVEIFRKILDMLDARERRHFFMMMGLVFIAGVADMVGIASILPFLTVVTDPSIIETQPVLNWIYGISGAQTPQAFTVVLGVGIFLVIVVGLVVKVTAIYAVTRFAHMRKHHIAMRILTGYMRQPYVWFLDRHSSELSKRVLHEVDQMVGSVILPVVRVMTQVVTISLIIGLLIIVEPVVAITAAVVLGSSYGMIFYIVRNLLVRLGTEVVEMNSARYRLMNEMTGGIKDVKLMGLEQIYLDNFRGPSYRHANALTKGQIIGAMPRYLLEGITLGGMVLVVLLLLRKEDGGITAALPVLGLFALAGMRLLPTIQQLYESLSMIRNSRTVFNVVHQDIVGLEDIDKGGLTGRSKSEALPLNKAISLKGVTYAYPKVDKPVLDDLSLEITVNTTVGIVGGTGAGKTTVIDILLGLLSPDDGTVEIDDVPLTRKTLRHWQNNIGYVPQHIFLTDATISENIAFGVAQADIDQTRVEQAAQLAELHDFVLAELPDGYETEVGERGVRLSGGQRQRIGIARALYHDPDVLILDEATSALDNVTERLVMQAVNDLGGNKTIIMIAHRLSTVKNCDVILYMERGKVVASGSYETLSDSHAGFRAMVEAAD